jgi:putative membrane protein
MTAVLLLALARKVEIMSLLFAAEEVSSFFPEHFWPGIAGSAIFGLVGIVLLLLGYWLFDLITPRIDVQKELCEKNVAVAVVIGALLLGIAYITAHVVQ